MRTSAQLVAPLFRSETQLRLLGALFLAPKRSWNMHELATDLHIPYASVHREITRLFDAGLLVEHRVGQARLFRADEGTAVFGPLRDLLVVSIGAVPLLAAALRDVAGVEAAAIYGSYAARLSGVPGPAPVDVDLLVIGRPDTRQVYAAAREVGAELKRPVNPTVLARDEWEAETAFLHSVRANPLLIVLGDLGSWGS